MCQFQALVVQQLLNSFNSSPSKKPKLNLSLSVGIKKPEGAFVQAYNYHHGRRGNDHGNHKNINSI